MSKNTEEQILSVCKSLYEKLKGGHFDDQPSSETKIELEGIKRDVANLTSSMNDSVGRLENAVEKFTESSDEKYADKKLTAEKFKNIEKTISFIIKIIWGVISAVVLAVIYAILNDIGIK